jgi:hypothetical protein
LGNLRLPLRVSQSTRSLGRRHCTAEEWMRDSFAEPDRGSGEFDDAQ